VVCFKVNSFCTWHLMFIAATCDGETFVRTHNLPPSLQSCFVSCHRRHLSPWLSSNHFFISKLFWFLRGQCYILLDLCRVHHKKLICNQHCVATPCNNFQNGANNLFGRI
jgi:hypothetical protein